MGGNDSRDFQEETLIEGGVIIIAVVEKRLPILRIFDFGVFALEHLSGTFSAPLL